LFTDGFSTTTAMGLLPTCGLGLTIAGGFSLKYKTGLGDSAFFSFGSSLIISSRLGCFLMGSFLAALTLRR
jgi:hypothetical protein